MCSVSKLLAKFRIGQKSVQLGRQIVGRFLGIRLVFDNHCRSLVSQRDRIGTLMVVSRLRVRKQNHGKSTRHQFRKRGGTRPRNDQ